MRFKWLSWCVFLFVCVHACASCVLQALSHVSPLRNYFLREKNYMGIKRPPGDQMFLLAQRFGELLRKLWNPRNFKAHVSPHEMLQAVVLCSHKRFQITKQSMSQITMFAHISKHMFTICSHLLWKVWGLFWLSVCGWCHWGLVVVAVVQGMKCDFHGKPMRYTLYGTNSFLLLDPLY